MRAAAATQATSAFHLPKQTLMISGITTRKWNDIVLLKQRFQSHRNDPLAFRPKFWLLLSKAGLETKIFGSGTRSFGRTRPTVQEDHFWKWTILTGKFPSRPKRPIYFWTKIFGNFGIMESTLCYSWWLLFRLVLTLETREMSAIFVFTAKTTQPRPQVFSVNGALTCKKAALLTSSVN